MFDDDQWYIVGIEVTVMEDTDRSSAVSIDQLEIIVRSRSKPEQFIPPGRKNL